MSQLATTLRDLLSELLRGERASIDDGPPWIEPGTIQEVSYDYYMQCLKQKTLMLGVHESCVIHVRLSDCGSLLMWTAGDQCFVKELTADETRHLCAYADFRTAEGTSESDDDDSPEPEQIHVDPAYFELVVENGAWLSEAARNLKQLFRQSDTHLTSDQHELLNDLVEISKSLHDLVGEIYNPGDRRSDRFAGFGQVACSKCGHSALYIGYDYESHSEVYYCDTCEHEVRQPLEGPRPEPVFCIDWDA